MSTLVVKPGNAEHRVSLLSWPILPSSLPLARFHQLALDRLQIDLGIAQGGLQVGVSQQFAHRRQADPIAQFDRRVGMAQPVDGDGFVLIDKTLGVCGARLLHVALEVIPDGTVIKGLPMPTAFAHVTPEERTNSAQRFEDVPQQRDTAAGVDQGDDALFVPLAHNSQIPAIEIVEMHVLYLQAQRLDIS